MQYQLRFYDGDHHLASRFDFIAPDDKEAEEAAALMSGLLAMELWAGDRPVFSWAAAPVPGASRSRRGFWRRSHA